MARQACARKRRAALPQSNVSLHSFFFFFKIIDGHCLPRTHGGFDPRGLGQGPALLCAWGTQSQNLPAVVHIGCPAPPDCLGMWEPERFAGKSWWLPPSPPCSLRLLPPCVSLALGIPWARGGRVACPQFSAGTSHRALWCCLPRTSARQDRGGASVRK